MSTDHWRWQEFAHSPLRLKKGASLFRQGGKVQSMYLLCSGRVTLTRHTPEGGTAILHVTNAGEMIAEASLFSSHYRYTAITARDADLLEISCDRILADLRNYHDSGLALLRQLAWQLRNRRGLMEVLNIRAVRDRILAYLNSIATADDRVRLESSRRDIACRLGQAPEIFYRELGRLIAGQCIRLLDDNTLIISG